MRPRPGVVATIRDAKEAGFKVAFVTTTSKDNLDALFAALATQLSAAEFDLIISSSDVEAAKPDPAAYVLALGQLGEEAGSCVAVEDNLGGGHAATAAGVACVAFPNENTAAGDFAPARTVREQVDFEELRSILPPT